MQREVEPFWRVALRLKWIGALFAALALAAGFALLGQWQLERSFRTVGQTKVEQVTPVSIDSLVTPGKGFPDKADARLVTVECARVNAQPVLIANRLQGGKSGYWLVDWCSTRAGTMLVTADAWYADLDVAKAARDAISARVSPMVMDYRQYRGWLLAPEAPEPATAAGAYVFKSLSIAQLVNQFASGPVEVYPGALALEVNPNDSTGGAQSIEISTQSHGVELNFLNIFYAIEWTVFAGFAVCMWWRLVQDERLGLRDGEGKLDQ